VASTGGVWNALVYGFGGMRDYRGVVTFDPRLPESWPELIFRISLKGSRVRVNLIASAMTFTVEEGSSATLAVRGNRFTVSSEAPVTIPLSGMGPRIDGTPRLQAGERRMDGSLITASVPQSRTIRA
jgi:alpha,alpha-trehalose phosphorylase